MTTVYTVQIENRQGATDTFKVATKAAAQEYLNGWADPQNLRVEVLREGREIGYKPFGRVRIDWVNY